MVRVTTLVICALSHAIAVNRFPVIITFYVYAEGKLVFVDDVILLSLNFTAESFH